MTKRIQLKIAGRVQGVFFRQSAKEKAERLGLKGWVKNTPQGQVAIVAEGEKEALKEFIQWCYNGPKWAQVEKIDVSWQKAKGNFEVFEIIT